MSQDQETDELEYTPEELAEAIAEHGSKSAAARALWPDLGAEPARARLLRSLQRAGRPKRPPGGRRVVEMSPPDLYELYVACKRNSAAVAEVLQCSQGSARRRIRAALAHHAAHPVIERANPDATNRVAELLRKANIDPSSIQRLGKLQLKSYGVFIKDKNEEIQTKSLYSTSVTIDPVLGVEDNPCLTQAPPITVAFAPPPVGSFYHLRKVTARVVISDTQYGKMRGPGGKGFVTIHDEHAHNVATQIVYAVQPTELYWIGDVGDATQFSRWPQHPEFEGCAQESLDVTQARVADTRSAAGANCTKALIIGGNHDLRYQAYADLNARAYSGLKRANALPDEWPVNSFPFLMRLDDMGIEYSGNFPGGDYWMLDDLVLTHAPPKRKEFAASVMHGHTHHTRETPEVWHGSKGARFTHYIYDVGCLCKVGTNIDPQSLVVTAVPSNRGRTDWTQSIGVVEVIEGKITKHQVYLPKIIDGWTMFHGQEFVSTFVEEPVA